MSDEPTRPAPAAKSEGAIPLMVLELVKLARSSLRHRRTEEEPK